MCVQDHGADRKYQRNTQALCGEQERGAHFHQTMRREYYLITLMGLKEAGEIHHDLQW